MALVKRYCLLFATFFCFNIAIQAQSGTCGNLKWSYYPSTKILIINGKGKMKDFKGLENTPPWWNLDFTSVTIAEGVTSIGDYAFYLHHDLTSVNIPNSVKSIGECAFSCCYGLTSVSIPENVKKIKTDAFSDVCDIRYSGKIKDAPWDARSINGYVDGYMVYKDATKTELLACSAAASGSIVIPNSVTVIGKRAFANCKKLTSVVIPDSVKEIGRSAFWDCVNLASVEIPAGITSIGYSAFWGVPHIAYRGAAMPRSYDDANWGARYKNGYVDGDMVYKDATKTELIVCSTEASGDIVIPNSVIVIGEEAFYNCNKLTSVFIPNSVTTIGERAFRNYKNLTINYQKGLNLTELKDAIDPTAKLVAMESAPAETTPMQPPLLALVKGSLEFLDVSKNNCINADEQNSISFKITNNGKGTAKACKVFTTMRGNSSGISVEPIQLPAIAPGATYSVSLPVQSSINTQNGSVAFNIEVSEPNGWGIAPFELIVSTRAYNPPFVQVVDYAVSSSSGKIRKMEPFTLTFNLQNTQYGDASDVHVKINLPNNVFMMDGDCDFVFPQLKSGEAKTIKVILAANNNFVHSELPVNIEVHEKYGKFAQGKQLPLALNQSATNSITVTAKDEPQQERNAIQLATIGSTVDKNIPQGKHKDEKAFAVIIANENYQQVASVPFALNDGNVFRQYCENTLGIPSDNIHYVLDATGNNIRQQVNWLQQVISAYNGEAKVIFYYAGHGVPDERSRTAYLLPVDGSGSDAATGYRLDDLYAALGSLPSRSVTVLLDACFSGSKREDGMLTSARGVAIKAHSGQPIGNMVVFSAATGDETAYPNRKEGHGLFTYFLLKKLQETAGDVTYGELSDYIKQNVSQQSIVLNGKPQTPTVTPSPAVAQDWQFMKL